MYTQAQYSTMISKLIAKLSDEFGIEVNRPVAAMADDYRSGDWFYETVGSTLNIKIWRWEVKKDPVLVYGPKWDDEQNTFERKLENELRAAISRLLD